MTSIILDLQINVILSQVGLKIMWHDDSSTSNRITDSRLQYGITSEIWVKVEDHFVANSLTFLFHC